MMRSALAFLILVTSPGCIEETRQADTSPPDSADTGDSDADDAADAESCSDPGVTRCAADRAATESCRNGFWERAPCASDKICIVAAGAQCVDSTGDKECRETLYCFVACQVAHGDDGEAGEACLYDCFRGATRPAQLELSAALTCFTNNCTDENFDCIAQRCSQVLADCYFDSDGDKRCAAIIECRLACGDDDVSCAAACGNDATFEAQSQYSVLELCTVYACAGQDADCARRESLPTGACGSYANECVGLLPNTPR